MASKMTFDSAFRDASIGKGLYKYESHLDFLIKEMESGNIDPGYFMDPNNDIILAKTFRGFNRTIDTNGISDKQYKFVAVLADKFKFNIRYNDICAFNNRFCLNGIQHDIERDPFLNTTRILNLLSKKVAITKDVIGKPDGYEYPLKLALEYFNFGFATSLIKYSYTLEKDLDFYKGELLCFVSVRF